MIVDRFSEICYNNKKSREIPHSIKPSIKQILFPLTVALALQISTTALMAFESKIFSVSGKTVTVVGDGVAHLKTGQKFGVYSGETKTGEIQIQQVSHTQAKIVLL